MNDKLKGLIAWLRSQAEEEMKYAIGRRQQASNRNASAQELEDARKMASAMCGRKIPKTSVQENRDQCNIQERIAVKQEAHSHHLSSWADELEAVLSADPQPQLTVEKLRAKFSDLAVEMEKHSNDHIHSNNALEGRGAAIEGVCADRIKAILREAQPAAPTPSEPPIHIGYNDNVVPADEPHDPTDCPACEPAPTPQLGTCKWSDEPHVKDGTGYGCTDWKPVEAPVPAPDWCTSCNAPQMVMPDGEHQCGTPLEMANRIVALQAQVKALTEALTACKEWNRVKGNWSTNLRELVDAALPAEPPKE